MLKFVIISDLHIVPRGELSHAVDTSARLSAAIDHINATHPDAAFCIAAGDLTDQGEIEAYQRLQELLAELKLPLYLTLGNHDVRTNFLKVFSDQAVAQTGFLDYCIDYGEHRILLMDSLDTGRHAGLLVHEQLAWLASRLHEAAERPVILVLHHNISDLQVSTDSIRLDQNEELLNRLRGYPNLRQVISGHVHLASSGVVQGIPFTTFAGCHYNIEPRIHDPTRRAPRIEGPGQYAVVWSGSESTIVLQEDFFTRHAVMPRELFH